MVRFSGATSPYAFNPAAVEDNLRALDAERVEDVALAIGRMTVPQQERLAQIASHGTHALYPELTTVQHLVNDVRRDRVKKKGGQFFEAFLTPDVVMRGLRRFQAKQSR